MLPALGSAVAFEDLQGHRCRVRAAGWIMPMAASVAKLSSSHVQGWGLTCLSVASSIGPQNCR